MNGESRCRYILDTSLIIDFIVNNLLNKYIISEGNVINNFASYILDILRRAKISEICIINLIAYEFLNKIIDKIIEIKLPITELQKISNNDVESFIDRIRDDFMNIGFGYINVSWSDIELASNIYNRIRHKIPRKERKTLIHKLGIGRDLLYFIISSRNNAMYITKDENFVKGLISIRNMPDLDISYNEEEERYDLSLLIKNYDVNIKDKNIDKCMIKGKIQLIKIIN
ncbi:hypothetical protein [Caldivirga maquilingensis]|uniref:PIN domain-containing protein n=1 Tax=Caldivirga maquilingensis (strain ATCC 700844 / DSM 13496 / JCM 10307 / IC-167) TaxID=397948 RepID=A8MA73_CALMQ|nr:hypothetical protein [Caldivirga maquilingensis]ABW01005.1 hypothetical protein Cmaq_0156 [Caldivirga maquilingensis IC-167]